jgi:hypothetical protein
VLESRDKKANFQPLPKICLFAQIEHHNIEIQRNPAKRESTQKINAVRERKYIE